jgi:hypothetical protein
MGRAFDSVVLLPQSYIVSALKAYICSLRDTREYQFAIGAAGFLTGGAAGGFSCAPK